MKAPFKILQDKIIYPVANFARKNPPKNVITFACRQLADFVYTCSKETALVMLGCNAIAILSSHNAQIKGLKKSDRENKDYLISQERIERTLDLLLSIVPPLLLNNYLKKKFESGAVTTKKFKEILENVVAPGVGIGRDELYSVEHIVPLRETAYSLTNKIATKILKENEFQNPKVETFIKKVQEKSKSLIKSTINDPMIFHPAILEENTTRLDNIIADGGLPNSIKKMLRNGSAYDELNGMINGLLILTTIGYSILTSNVIMPYLRNKMANKNLEKRNKKLNKVTNIKQEDIERRKRYEFHNNEIHTTDIFNTFTTTHQSTSKIFSEFKEPISINQQKSNQQKTNPFEKFNTIPFQSTRLKI